MTLSMRRPHSCFTTTQKLTVPNNNNHKVGPKLDENSIKADISQKTLQTNNRAASSISSFIAKHTNSRAEISLNISMLANAAFRPTFV